MTGHRFAVLVPVVLLSAAVAWADAPVASYIFPAGGQRGRQVAVKVGGLNLHRQCDFQMTGPGVQVSDKLERTETVWFEGPVLPLPDSQRAEDYPKDMAGTVTIAADAPLGVRHWRLATSQGITPAQRFVIGDLPEIVEQEIAGDPVPVPVTLPVTINGRIFPREDVDIWTFAAGAGQSITCEVVSARLGLPLDSRLEIVDPQGRVIAENDDGPWGADSFLRFTAPASGTYQVRIHDINFQGGQAYVYRLTVTADPFVDRVYPLGGRRGETINLELSGQSLPKGSVAVPLPADAPLSCWQRVKIGNQWTNPFLLDVDDVPEYRETEPNDELSQALAIQCPCVVNGRIAKQGDVDGWALELAKDEYIQCELRAQQLGSPLLGILTILDATGKELARADSGSPISADPVLFFRAPADGRYVLRVSDRFRSRGGPEFAYRVRVTPAEPGFSLRLPSEALTVTRGSPAKLRVSVERQGGFHEAIELRFDGLPPGVTVTNPKINPKQAFVDVTLQAEEKSPLGVNQVRVRGSAKVGEKEITRTAIWDDSRWGGMPLDRLYLAVAPPTPFKIVGDYDMRWAPRGTQLTRRYRIERIGYDGPIEVSLADSQARHLQGVTGPTIMVPAGVNEFDYTVQFPPWMETGRTSRSCVMGVAVIKDHDGAEHIVSYSSKAQNDQIIAVVGPCPIDVQIERGSLAILPGQSVELPVRVIRSKAQPGPVRLEVIIPSHMTGIQAETITLPADQERGTLLIHFTKNVSGPFNMPLRIRARLQNDKAPAMDEADVALHGVEN
ncbi:MAG: pre-peptidase C-terminal domain-containing protein [Gemmataceae bacterium]